MYVWLGTGVCAHLLPEVEPPGNIGVGVVLIIGALMKLRLDGLLLNRELSGNYSQRVTLVFTDLYPTLYSFIYLQNCLQPVALLRARCS